MSKVVKLREEIAALMEPASHVGEIIKVMGKDQVLVKVGKKAMKELR